MKRDKKPIFIVLLLALVTVLCGCMLFACGEPSTDPGTGTETETETPDDKPKKFENITFTDMSVDYDGQEHELVIAGTAPAGTTVVYENNKATDPGTYDAVVTLSLEGYETLTLNATLKIIAPPLSMGSKTVAYDKYIYFLDLYKNKELYSYDTVTGTLTRKTTIKVSDFAIVGDTLYYNAVTMGVNNDLYKLDLKNGGSPVHISQNDCTDIVSDGVYVYCIKHNAVGAATAIVRIGGGEETVIHNKGVSDLTYYKGYLYFVQSSKLWRISVSDSSVGEPENVTNSSVSHVDTFCIDGDVVYFRELYGFAYGFKRLSRMNIDGANYSVLITANTDPLELCVSSGYVYYYNDVVSGTSGLYRISVNATDGVTAAELLLNATSGTTNYYASTFTVYGGKIYFINYRSNLGDSRFYSFDMSTKAVVKIA